MNPFNLPLKKDALENRLNNNLFFDLYNIISQKLMINSPIPKYKNHNKYQLHPYLIIYLIL
jgi:hypothetical protein